MEDKTYKCYERICQSIIKKFRDNPQLYYNNKILNDTSERLKELEIVRKKIIYEGYDAATRFRKGQVYDTTKEYLNGICSCEAAGGQCSLYCRKYGECNGID